MSSILIIYPFFPPAKRAGGIVSSLTNLVTLLDGFTLFVATSCYDLDGAPLEVEQNRWIDYAPNCKVIYATKDYSIDWLSVVEKNRIQSVYINGVYGLNFVIKPLWQLRHWKKEPHNNLIIAPRGMIQKGSLTIKPTKKRLYFSILKSLGFFKGIRWHATDAQELVDIKSFFGTDNVCLATDSPSLKPSFIDKEPKTDAVVRLVYLSLLTEKKNLKFLLNVLHGLSSENITLDIYGPIKDQNYWNDCLASINALSTVRYCGEVAPTEVTRVINGYDYFVLPTLGENFGHVIFESLVAGTPVIISDRTPWKDMDAEQVGWCVPLERELWINRLMGLSEIDTEAYNAMSERCHGYITRYIENNNPIEEYIKLFKEKRK